LGPGSLHKEVRMFSSSDIRFFIEKSQHLLILCHSNADPDALGCALSIKHYFKNKDISICCDGISKQAKHILDSLGGSLGELEAEPDAIIVLDTSSPSLLGKCMALLDKTDNLAVIDHHTTTDFKPKLAYRKCATSNAELVWEVLEKPNDIFIRKALLAGIMADTGHLKYANRQTFIALAEMIGDDILFEDIFSLFRKEVELSQRIALMKALQRMRIIRVKDYIIVRTSIGSFESFIARSILNIGADVVIIINEKRGSRIVARAGRRVANKGLNLATIMHESSIINNGEGGGHPSAAGSKGVDDFKKAADDIIDAIRQVLEGD